MLFFFGRKNSGNWKRLQRLAENFWKYLAGSPKNSVPWKVARYMRVNQR